MTINSAANAKVFSKLGFKLDAQQKHFEGNFLAPDGHSYFLKQDHGPGGSIYGGLRSWLRSWLSAGGRQRRLIGSAPSRGLLRLTGALLLDQDQTIIQASALIKTVKLFEQDRWSFDEPERRVDLECDLSDNLTEGELTQAIARLTALASVLRSNQQMIFDLIAGKI